METSYLPESLNQKYQNFFNATANNQILDPKTTLLVQLAASMAISCAS